MDVTKREHLNSARNKTYWLDEESTKEPPLLVPESEDDLCSIHSVDSETERTILAELSEMNSEEEELKEAFVQLEQTRRKTRAENKALKMDQKTDRQYFQRQRPQRDRRNRKVDPTSYNE